MQGQKVCAHNLPSRTASLTASGRDKKFTGLLPDHMSYTRLDLCGMAFTQHFKFRVSETSRTEWIELTCGGRVGGSLQVLDLNVAVCNPSYS